MCKVYFTIHSISFPTSEDLNLVRNLESSYNAWTNVSMHYALKIKTINFGTALHMIDKMKPTLVLPFGHSMCTKITSWTSRSMLPCDWTSRPMIPCVERPSLCSHVLDNWANAPMRWTSRPMLPCIGCPG